MQRTSTWWPGIDALRGVAVVAVVLYHHSPDAVPGGFLGVSLFFTLSGFLITTLLLREREATGSIRLGRFWSRRLRRLAPVGLCGLCLAAAVGAVVQDGTALAATAADVRAAALHVANWRFAAGGVTYGDAVGVPSPVTHYWSLSVEEQFYAAFPILALLSLRRGRRAFVAVLVVAVVGSLACQLTLDPSRAYLGTDARAAELAVGALAAVVRLRWPAAARRRPVDAAAAIALVVLLAAWATVELGDTRLFRGGLVLHAVAAALVVVAAADGRLVAALGRVRPLVALGAVSYGVYVVHWPLLLLLDQARTGLEGPALLAVRAAATVALATALHVAVEQPVRRGAALPRWEAPVALTAAMGVTLLLATALPHVEPAERGGDPAAPTFVAMSAAATTTTTQGPGADAPVSVEPIDVPPEPPTATPMPAAVAAPADVAAAAAAPSDLDLLVVGDSSAEFVGAGMQQWAERAGARVHLYYSYACTFLHSGEYLIREGWVYRQSDACRALVGGAVAVATELDVDGVVVFAGNFQVASWRPDDAVAFSAVGDPLVDVPVLQALSSAFATLAGAGVPVVVADLPVPAWDADRPTPSGTLPGSGPPTINDTRRVARLNELTAQAVAEVPLARLLPWASILAGPDGSIEPAERPDGLHVDPEVAESLMDGALGRAIADLLAGAAP